MALVRIHRVIENVNSSTYNQYVVGPRGGILLDLKLTHKPRTYVAADPEQVKFGNIHVAVVDSGDGRLILGQTSLSVPLPNSIVVPSSGEWSWQHPRQREILAAGSFLEFMYFGTLSTNIIGLFSGQIGFGATWDPVKQVVHDLVIEALVFAFAGSA